MIISIINVGSKKQWQHVWYVSNFFLCLQEECILTLVKSESYFNALILLSMF